MQNWRRSPGGREQQNSHRQRSRPPCHQGPTYTPVPAWEKNFCTSVCSIPWKKLCETKSKMSMFPNVVDWDDSAAMEGFWNAKYCFWAEINGVPSDIPLPDPDMFIDKIDYYPIIDPELVADLDKAKAPPANRDSHVAKASDLFGIANKPIIATGWGDAEDPPLSNCIADKHCSVNYREQPIVPTGRVDAEYSIHQSGIAMEPHYWNIQHNSNSALNSGSGINHSYFGSAWDSRVVWGSDIVQNNSWRGGQDNSRENSFWSTQQNKNYESGRRYVTKRDGGQFGFISSNPSYQLDNYQTNNRWSDGSGNNRMYAEQSLAMW